jgi:hypothetical protein
MPQSPRGVLPTPQKTSTECNPPQRLVVSWVPPADEGNAEKTSRVSFDIEPFKEGVVRLTVTHDELEPDSEMLRSVSFGWPAVISALKTLLETGKIGTMAAQKSSQPVGPGPDHSTQYRER